jgi:hypothetical protein
VSIAREDDWYVDVFDVLEAVILMICASLGSEHLEILFLTEKFVMGCGWQCQGRLPESLKDFWVVEIVIFSEFDPPDFVIIDHYLTCVKCRD